MTWAHTRSAHPARLFARPGSNPYSPRLERVRRAVDDQDKRDGIGGQRREGGFQVRERRPGPYRVRAGPRR
ncbi:hypothetical protein ACU686_09985 [Yinghuangia aomiensis]